MEQIGRYQILAELGRGAMGVVYRALDPAIVRPVAIKTIRLSDITDDSDRERLRDRLFREAQSAGMLSHPGIVTIYDVGEQDDITYIAMEYVNGPTLEKLMSGQEPLDRQRLFDILRQTAAALDFAHKKGIVHRDIKPANIMINEDGTPKITDFGVAKFSHGQQMTQAGTVVGTPNYMSPEQIEGKNVDGRTDQFALGVIVYELLTGEKPFAGEHLTNVLYKIVSEEPTPPHTINRSLPWSVAMVVGRAMAKDPSKRYPSATEFTNALEAALQTKKEWKAMPRGASQTLPTAIAPAPKLPDRPAATPDEPLREHEGGGLFWKMVGAALAGLAVVAVLFFAAQRWLDPEPETVEVADVAPPQQPQTRSAPAPPPPEQPKVEPRAEPRTAEPPKTEPAKPEPAEPEPVKPRPRSPAVAAAPAPDDTPYQLQLVTNPPGATATIDSDPAKTCKAPCSLDLLPGRHTIAVNMEGYRRELRIVELYGPRELFFNLSRAGGTVRVESQPPGAQIIINGEIRHETTPASIRLPVGKYHITVTRDGRKADQEIEVRDGALLRYTLDLNP